MGGWRKHPWHGDESLLDENATANCKSRSTGMHFDTSSISLTLRYPLPRHPRSRASCCPSASRHHNHRHRHRHRHCRRSKSKHPRHASLARRRSLRSLPPPRGSTSLQQQQQHLLLESWPSQTTRRYSPPRHPRPRTHRPGNGAPKRPRSRRTSPWMTPSTPRPFLLG